MEHTSSLESIPDDALLRRLAELLRQSRRVDAARGEPSPDRGCEAGSTPDAGELRDAPGRAAHRTKREIEELIAEVAPRPDAPTVVRKLPDRGAGTAPVQALRDDLDQGSVPSTHLGLDRVELPGLKQTPEAASSDSSLVPACPGPHDPPRAVPGRPGPQRVEPLSLGCYKVQFTASAEMRDKLERLTALMRSSVPDGDLGAIIEHAVTETLERLETRRFAKTNAPRKSLADSDTSPSSRHPFPLSTPEWAPKP